MQLHKHMHVYMLMQHRCRRRPPAHAPSPTTNICISIYLNALLRGFRAERKSWADRGSLFTTFAVFLSFFSFLFVFSFPLCTYVYIFWAKVLLHNLCSTHICYLSPAKWIVGFIYMGIQGICVRRCAWSVSEDLQIRTNVCSVSCKFLAFISMRCFN